MNAPELELGNELYYFGFRALEGSRNFELGPIPYNIIKDYANDLDMDYDQFERFRQVIASVDRYYIKKISEEMTRSHGRGNKRPILSGKSNVRSG